MTKFRAFKISINIITLRIYQDSRVFKIDNLLIHILLVIWYTLVSFFLGWWGIRFFDNFMGINNTSEALQINLSGGIDYSKEMDELNYDGRTNYVWNNILRKTKEKVEKKEVEFIIDVQDEFEKLIKKNYTEENVDFIMLNLSKIDIHRITRQEIKDILDGIRLYNEIK